MTTTQTEAGRLAAFAEEHGHVIANALQVYAERMRETAAQCETAATGPEPGPAPEQPGVINLTPTPRGWASMARAFTEAAERAERAAKAWEEITE